MNADELRRTRRVAQQRIRQTLALRRAAAASLPNQRLPEVAGERGDVDSAMLLDAKGSSPRK